MHRCQFLTVRLMDREMSHPNVHELRPVLRLLSQADTNKMELIDTVKATALIIVRRAGLLSLDFVCGYDFFGTVVLLSYSVRSYTPLEEVALGWEAR